MTDTRNEYAWLAFVSTAVNQYIADHVTYVNLEPLDRQAWLALDETEKARLRIMQSWCQTTYLTHMTSAAKAMHAPLRTCGYAVAAHYLAWALNDGDLMRCSDVEYIGDDYADVSLTATGQEGLAVECRDEASAIALAAAIAELFRRYCVDPVAVGTVREPFSDARVPEFVGPAVSVAGRLD
jgi:hypothetical protein